MSSIRSILNKLLLSTDQDLKTRESYHIDQALLEISQIINPIISDIDRLYTDEYDRKLWNEFKYEVQSNLKKVLK